MKSSIHALARAMPLSIVAAGLSLAISGAASGQPAGPPEEERPPVTGQTVTPPAAAVHGDESAVGAIDHPDWSLAQREERLGADLDKSIADGSLGHAEYARAHAALVEIRAAEDRLRKRNHGELTDSETFRLEGRIKLLAASIHWKR
jgi:hypothetical protein